MEQLTNTAAVARVVRPAGPGLVAMAGLVALGGAVGTTARAVLESAFPSGVGGWPWTTFWINLGGSFLLGALLELLSHAGPDRGARRVVRLGIGTGVIGGFTTYSTFVLETVHLVQAGWLVTAAVYGMVSVVLGIVAAGAGMTLVATMWRWRAHRQGDDSQDGRP